MKCGKKLVFTYQSFIGCSKFFDLISFILLQNLPICFFALVIIIITTTITTTTNITIY